jgi:hypothetical protein
LILDFAVFGAAGYKEYTILDGRTGRCLDDQRIFYADSDRGFYRAYIVGGNGQPYLWDRRTKERAGPETPEKYRELAWEQVHRPIAIFKKGS